MGAITGLRNALRGGIPVLEGHPDVMGIIWGFNPDGTKSYRCRGIGKTYDRFYREWVPQSSYRCTGVNFPWDYFVFDDDSDHAILLMDFGDIVSYEDDEEG